MIQDQNKGWSDYRIGCSKEIDLDILPQQISLDTYSATLGHKVILQDGEEMILNLTTGLSLLLIQRSLRAPVASKVREDHGRGGQPRHQGGGGDPGQLQLLSVKVR